MNNYSNYDLPIHAKAKPLSKLLLDCRLTNSSDRDRAVDAIGIYALKATNENIDKYFRHNQSVNKWLNGAFGENYCIEEFLAMVEYTAYWNEEHKLTFAFKNSNY